MSTVVQSNSTYAQIELLIRRLTASPSQSALPSSDIQQLTNTFYSQDFPYGIKLDQMRSVYHFYTTPYIDRYPLDVNYNQGVRAPMYVEGIQGSFFKDRNEFYNMWPRWPSKFTPASGDGVTQTFTFTITGPFLSKEVTLGIATTTGSEIVISDSNGDGILYLQVPNAVTSNPSYATNPVVPGMYNTNTGNPGLIQVTAVGTVNYVTGVFSIDLSAVNLTPASGTTWNVFVSQYSTGRPYSMLFWNNEFTIRPVPKLVHKIEIETYLTPVQFMQTTDSPILNQWVQYIAYGVSCEIMRQRQDMEGLGNLIEGFKRQEGLVLERQGVEEIGSRNATIFASSQNNQGWNNNMYGSGWGI